MEIKDLLEVRKKLKSKKPDFVRQDNHKKRLKNRRRWRRPRGLHSKVRLQMRGKPKKISTGYGSPNKVKGLDKIGLMPVSVSNIKDIDSLNKEKQCAVLDSRIGSKKRYDILKKIKETGIKVLNFKDIDAFIKKTDDKLKARKEARKKLKEKKEKKKADKPKKEEKLSDKVSEEDKKKEEKKEKDKVLTKKT